MSTPMSPNAPSGPDDFRERLSAWHDGALPDEASRFVLKRLLQDEGLRAEVGRWQVVGDVLRRRAQQVPAPTLPANVAAAIDAELAAAVRQAPRPRMAGWWASAAAVGLAAVLLMPDGEPSGASGEATFASGPGSTAGGTAGVEVPASPVRRVVPMPRVLLAEAEPASLVARVPPLVRAPQPTSEQLAPLPALDLEAPSRPWPRSAGAAEAYTVEYAMPSGDTPSRQ